MKRFRLVWLLDYHRGSKSKWFFRPYGVNHIFNQSFFIHMYPFFHDLHSRLIRKYHWCLVQSVLLFEFNGWNNKEKYVFIWVFKHMYWLVCFEITSHNGHLVRNFGRARWSFSQFVRLRKTLFSMIYY